MQSVWLYAPPITFVIILAAVLAFAKLASALSFKNPKPGKSRDECYACGEDVKEHRIQPDYSKFFPFAYFFTIIHVVALIISTVPKVTADTLVIAVLYIAGALTGLSILFRRTQ
ncbi:MAG: DUF983 domain-containing protein [Elusimicrobiota bacterium]